MVFLDPVLKSGDDELIERVRAALRLPAERRRKNAPAPAPARPKDDPASTSEIGPKQMGERSYRAGYLQDALRYFHVAHDLDPLDFGVLLKLGWTYNALHQDQLAMAWFDLARRSPDRSISSEASRAYRNIRPSFARWRVTSWVFPFYSSRWSDVFSYAQVKVDRKLDGVPIRPYISMRIIGDTRRMEDATSASAVPQYLSERSIIAAFGVATNTWHGATIWGEAGSAIRYTGVEGRGRMVPDYRGGIAFARGAGRLLGSRHAGLFAETHDDGVFVSRFENDFLMYSQNQAGFTLPPMGGVLAQLYWNVNVTTDTQRQGWANFYENGPGSASAGPRFRPRWSSRSTFCADRIFSLTNPGRRSTTSGRDSGMRSLAKLALALLPAVLSAQPFWYSVSGDDPASWPAVLSSLGFQPQAAGAGAGIVVLRRGARPVDALALAESGTFVIVEGQSDAAVSAGFRPGSKTVRVQSVEDLRRPQLRIIWERALDLPVCDLPAGARVFTRERWTGAPLVAGFRRGAGAILWVAADPGSARLRTLPLPAARAGGPRFAAAVSIAPPVGVLRFLLPHTRRSRLPCAALARLRHLRPARRRLALL